MSAFDPTLLDTYTQEAGVYLMKNGKGGVIYVGKAKNLRNRLKQYFVKGRDGRPMVPFLLHEIAAIDVIVVPSEKEALLLENTLIKKHQPKFNALLKDDKTFISLMINAQHPWPRLQLVRSKGKQEGLFFGPYTSADAARQTLNLMQRLFPLRQCSDEELKRRTRPCLLYGMKRCVAPCVGLTSRAEYTQILESAIAFLNGNDRTILAQLKHEMQAASDRLEFERAASLLTLMRHIEHVVGSKTIVAQSSGKAIDAIGLHREGFDVMLVHLFFREGKLTGSEHYLFSAVVETDVDLISSFIIQYYKKAPQAIVTPLPLPTGVAEIVGCPITAPHKGDKKEMVRLAEKNAAALFKQKKTDNELTEKLLLTLQETLVLSRYPERIECFDISHTGGGDTVGSMVAFTDGKYDKKRSRLFKIKSAAAGDDYAALREVIFRRLARAKEENDLPDLVIIDGGKAHLNVLEEVIKALDIATVDLMAIAKEKSKHTKGLTQEVIFTVDRKETLPLHSPLLFLLQKIRDETHRRAIGFHRKRREKRLLSSLIEEIPGVGPIKQKRLLAHFGSVERVARASDTDLLAVKSITRKDITSIREFFRRSLP